MVWLDHLTLLSVDIMLEMPWLDRITQPLVVEVHEVV